MPKFFEKELAGNASQRHRKVYGRYQKLYTINDFLAAVFFLAGSVMFFYESLQIPATWFFTLGSINFMLRPTISLLREFHLANIPMPGDASRQNRA